MLRKCIKCGLEAHTREELEQFSKSEHGKHGRMNICKPCKSKESIQYHHEHPKKRTPNPETRHHYYSQLVNRIGGSTKERSAIPKKTRIALLERTNNTCELKGRGRCNGTLVIHHINGDSNKLSNLNLLCTRHHRKTHRKHNPLQTPFTP